MSSDSLRILSQPPMHEARMVMGLSGWMDGGEVSTGSVAWLVRALGAPKLAEIDPQPFYLYSFPGTMEVSAMFRPHAKIENGLITRLDHPSNVFYGDARNNLVLFSGKEPNLRWDDYADCVFTAAQAFGVTRIYFVGSVAGVVPHTRDPRLFGSASDEPLRDELVRCGIRPSTYQGPASLVTYLTVLARGRGVGMAALVAEIPGYIQGVNPICIESVTRRLAAMLGLPVDLEDLRAAGEAFENRLNEKVLQKPEMGELVLKLEADYDNEVFDTQLGDFKEWLEEKGIRLD